MHRLVLALFLALAASPVAADTPARFHETLRLGDKIFVVAETDGEPHSIGSFSVRAYQSSLDEYIDGRFAVREGEIAAAWATHLDGDGQPDVLVWTRSAGSGSYGELTAFTLSADGQLRRFEIQAPDGSLMDDYMGHDRYELIGGVLYRSFPRYAENDANAEPTRGQTRLRYRPAERRWERVEPVG